MEHMVLGHFKFVSEEVSRQSLEASLFHCGCRSIAWAREMIKVMDFTPAWDTIEFKAVAVPVAELLASRFAVGGRISGVANLERIIHLGEENGLQRCFSRVGPMLVAGGGLPKDQIFIVAMDPVGGVNGSGIFEIRKGYLGACHAESNVSFPKETLFVFMLEAE